MYGNFKDGTLMWCILTLGHGFHFCDLEKKWLFCGQKEWSENPKKVILKSFVRKNFVEKLVQCKSEFCKPSDFVT